MRVTDACAVPAHHTQAITTAALQKSFAASSLEQRQLLIIHHGCCWKHLAAQQTVPLVESNVTYQSSVASEHCQYLPESVTCCKQQLFGFHVFFAFHETLQKHFILFDVYFISAAFCCRAYTRILCRYCQYPLLFFMHIILLIFLCVQFSMVQCLLFIKLNCYFFQLTCCCQLKLCDICGNILLIVVILDIYFHQCFIAEKLS